MIDTLIDIIYDPHTLVYLFWSVAGLIGITVGGGILIAYEYFRLWRAG